MNSSGSPYRLGSRSERGKSLKGYSLLALVALTFFTPTFAPTDAHGEDPPPFAFSWGGPGNVFGSFNSPMAITVDASGDVYVVD